RANVQRRRARAAGSTRAATAATAAAITLDGVAASAGYPTPSARAETFQEAAGTTGAAPARCPDHPLTGSSAPSGFVEVDGTAFFTAADGVHGEELWKSDGTRAGTVLVKDIQRGTFYDGYYQATFPSSSGPSYLTAVGGKLYFTANDGVHGEELWKSDGTKAGTVMVKDI